MLYTIIHAGSHDWQVWTLSPILHDQRDFVKSFWTRWQAHNWIGKAYLEEVLYAATKTGA